MSGIGGWAGSGAGLIMIGASWVLMRYLHHLPKASHPVLHRLEIIGMYAGGATLVLTSALGLWVIRAELWALGLFGGVSGGTGHAAVVIAATFLAAAVLVALVFIPDSFAAWLALALPFVLALSGGHLHDMLTVFPGPALAQQVSQWLGG